METGDDKIEIMQSFFTILRWHRLWPKKGVKFSDKLFIIQKTLILIFGSWMVIGSVLHISHTFITGGKYNLVDIIEDIIVIGSGIGLYLIIFIIIFHSQLIEKLVADLSNFKKFKKPPTVDKLNSNVNTLLKGFYAYANMVMIIYGMIGLLSKKQCKLDNIKNDTTNVCGMMLPSWLPFDATGFPIFQIFFILQVLSCLSFVSIGFVINGFVIGVVEIFITRIVHLKTCIAEISNIQDTKATREQLIMCIRYHIDIIKLWDRINYVMGMIGLINTNYSSVLISLLSFQIMLEPSITCLFQMMGWIVILFLPCYSGQRIINESSDISFEMYSTNWYHKNLDVQKDLKFIIMRSNKHMTLNAMGFGEISIETFGNAMQTSFSILTLFHTIYE